jgi:hypothetical protein
MGRTAVKVAPLTGSAFQGHLAAEGVEDVLDDGKAQPGPAELSTARFVHAVKALE